MYNEEDEHTDIDEYILIHNEALVIIKKPIIALETIRINWKKAKHGWARYYDDGIITLDPDVFFGKKKKEKE